jgi:hypothetical protein
MDNPTLNGGVLFNEDLCLSHATLRGWRGIFILSFVVVIAAVVIAAVAVGIPRWKSG